MRAMEGGLCRKIAPVGGILAARKGGVRVTDGFGGRGGRCRRGASIGRGN